MKDSPQEISETSTDIDTQAFETVPTELPIPSIRLTQQLVNSLVIQREIVSHLRD